MHHCQHTLRWVPHCGAGGDSAIHKQVLHDVTPAPARTLINPGGHRHFDNAATPATHRVKLTSWIEAMHKSVQDNHQRSILLNAANAIANISWVFWAKQLATGAITAGALAVLLSAGIKLAGGAIRMRARRLQVLQG